MLMRYCEGCSLYTLKASCAKCEKETRSAHPARFTPDDKYSKYRVELKKKYGLLPTQKPAEEY
ncbi:H/ACA ribonucleoprotein complex subunit [Acrasis kona]|uniref:Ribosome biogenesis protein Nop10 n=1 Tax=Acrasis kona TaxID=1008807 RepID=A0AAW2Z6B8_9EUKA